MTTTETAATQSDREIVTTRVFSAPRALVFRAWTDPEHLPNWYGPRGFTTTVQSMDVRPGGAFEIVMRGPDGTDHLSKFLYREVVDGERIVYERAGDRGDASVRFVSTVTFEEVEGGRTRVVMRMVFPTAEARAYVVENYGAVEGGRQTFDRLAEHLGRQAGKGPDALTISLPSDREMRLTRSFFAPRWLVWTAMTRPEHVARWWGPRGMSLSVCEMDFRPGGAWRFDLRAPDGRVSPFKGEYREIVPPERVVQTFIFDVDVIRDFPALETLTLSEHDGRTTITIDVLHMNKEARDGHLNSGMEAGANETYERLAEYLKTMA